MGRPQAFALVQDRFSVHRLLVSRHVPGARGCKQAGRCRPAQRASCRPRESADKKDDEPADGTVAHSPNISVFMQRSTGAPVFDIRGTGACSICCAARYSLPNAIWLCPCRAHRRTNIFCCRSGAKPNGFCWREGEMTGTRCRCSPIRAQQYPAATPAAGLRERIWAETMVLSA